MYLKYRTEGFNIKNMNIAIEGHICCKPEGHEDGLDNDFKEYVLSHSRAEYIYDVLISKGINKNRMSHKGYSDSQMIYPDEINEEQKKANRRVEIKIVSK